MIRCNLSLLLAERGLKITKVSTDTGLSRTTLTALVSNSLTGIQLETINLLCLYLNVSPDELISFVPAEITPSKFSCDMETIKDMPQGLNGFISYDEVVTFRFVRWWFSDEKEFKINAHVMANMLRPDEQTSRRNIFKFKANVTFSFMAGSEYEENNKLLAEAFSSFPRAFLPQIEREFSFAHIVNSAPIERTFYKGDVVRPDYHIAWPPEILGLMGKM